MGTAASQTEEAAAGRTRGPRCLGSRVPPPGRLTPPAPLSGGLRRPGVWRRVVLRESEQLCAGHMTRVHLSDCSAREANSSWEGGTTLPGQAAETCCGLASGEQRQNSGALHHLTLCVSCSPCQCRESDSGWDPECSPPASVLHIPACGGNGQSHFCKIVPCSYFRQNVERE